MDTDLLFREMEKAFDCLCKVVRPTLTREGNPKELVDDAIQEAALSLWMQLQKAYTNQEPLSFNHTHIFSRAVSRSAQLQRQEARRCLMQKKSEGPEDPDKADSDNAIIDNADPVPVASRKLPRQTARHGVSEPEWKAGLQEQIDNLDPCNRDLFNLCSGGREDEPDTTISKEEVAQRQNMTVHAVDNKKSRLKGKFFDNVSATS